MSIETRQKAHKIRAFCRGTFRGLQDDTLNQLAVLQVFALHDDLIVQAHLIVGAELAVRRDQNVIFVLIQDGDF